MTLNDLINIKLSQPPNKWIGVDDIQVIHSLVYANRAEYFIECGTCDGFSACVGLVAMIDAGIEEPVVHTWDIEDREKFWDVSDHWPDFITFHHGSFDRGVREVIQHRDTSKRMVVFIDGDHNEEPAKADFLAVEPHLRVDDIVIFHDARRYKHLQKLYEGLCRLGKYEGMYIPTRKGIAVVRKCHKK